MKLTHYRVFDQEGYVTTKGLGDAVHDALAKVGVTPERVSRWLGFPCGCWERQRRLNELGWWAASVLRGRGAKRHLEEMMSEEQVT